MDCALRGALEETEDGLLGFFSVANIISVNKSEVVISAHEQDL